MERNDRHIEFNALLTRYLSGELSGAEIARLEVLLMEDPVRRKELEEYRKIWDRAGDLKSQDPASRYDMDAEWEVMKDRLPGFRDSAEVPDSTGRPKGTIRSILFYTYRMAAAVLVGGIFVFVWLYATRWSGTGTVMAENEPVEVVLPDGTEVVINRNSRLRYPREMEGQERRVRLRGEAWFDVTPDPDTPFRIEAGDALVEVLGTSFNVNAYRKNNQVEITVSSGVVAFSDRHERQEQIVLQAGNSGIYDRVSREIQLIPSADPNNLAWKTREFYFRGTPLSEVVSQLNKVYRIRMVIVNPQLDHCPITVTFMDQSLEAVLMVLEATLDLKISRRGDEILLDGEGCEE